MKKKNILFITAALTAVCGTGFTTANADNNYGTEVPELLELYENYCDTDYEALYFEEATSEYSSYCAVQKMADIGYIVLNDACILTLCPSHHVVEHIFCRVMFVKDFFEISLAQMWQC